MARLILVYNPNSSKYCHVKTDILARRDELFSGAQPQVATSKVGGAKANDAKTNDAKTGLFQDYITIDYVIQKVAFDENVSKLAQQIKDGDICLSLGGDATAAISANAIIKSRKSATLAVLPYGNFNDLARTLKTMKYQDFASTKIINLYPLAIYINKKLWRYATSYVTIGMTAEAVKLFDEPKFRKHMQKGHKSSLTSYFALANWYFKNRSKKQFLSKFTVNGKPAAQNASDYAAVNGRSMCRVMRGGDDYKKPKVFRSETAHLTSFPRLFDLMAKSIFHRVPGEETKGDLLEFENPARLELQAEGEYQVFENVKTIEVKKGDVCLKVMQA